MINSIDIIVTLQPVEIGNILRKIFTEEEINKFNE